MTRVMMIDAVGERDMLVLRSLMMCSRFDEGNDRSSTRCSEATRHPSIFPLAVLDA